MNIFYVYCYKDPRTLLPFYIGKGSKDRSKFHLRLISCNLHKNRYFANIVKLLKSNGLEPIIEIIEENLLESDAYSLEKKLIKQYGRKLFDKNGILCNLTEGGIGPIGYKHSLETKMKMKKLKQNISLETREKMRLSHLGKKQSQELITKRRIAMTGVPKNSINMHHLKSPEHKNAISISKSMKWICISPSNVKFITKSLKNFCKEYGLKETALKTSLRKQSPVTRGCSKGWQLFLPAL